MAIPVSFFQRADAALKLAQSVKPQRLSVQLRSGLKPRNIDAPFDVRADDTGGHYIEYRGKGGLLVVFGLESVEAAFFGDKPPFE